MTAAEVGDSESVQKVLLSGASDGGLEFDNYVEAATYTAAVNGNADLLATLIEKRSVLGTTADSSGLRHPAGSVFPELINAALHDSAGKGLTDVIEILLTCPDVNQLYVSPDRRGSPLAAAAARNHLEVVKILLSHGPINAWNIARYLRSSS